MSILNIENLTFAYNSSDRKVFDGFSQSFDEGRIYAIVGRSGVGKTTLLSLLSGLTSPTDGKIYVGEKDISSIDKYEYRSHDVGVVFQGYNLLPKLTAAENVILSMDISGKEFADKKAYAVSLLENVGLSETETDRPVVRLSGGQQQRVAIARAISFNPRIILADEPTGNLDGETQDEIMALFRKLAHEEDKCVIIVTHSPQVAEAADQVIAIEKASRNKETEKAINS